MPQSSYSTALQKAQEAYFSYQNPAEFGSFLHFVLQDIDFLELNLKFSAQDWDILIEEADHSVISSLTYNPLMSALIHFNQEARPLNAEHFDILLEKSDLKQKDQLELPALLYMFVHGNKTPFKPTPEKVMQILQETDLNFQFEDWNVLHYALYYKKIGQTPLNFEHLEYLFNHCSKELYPLPRKQPEDTYTQIKNQEAQYRATKEKLFLQQSLPATKGAISVVSPEAFEKNKNQFKI